MTKKSKKKGDRKKQTKKNNNAKMPQTPTPPKDEDFVRKKIKIKKMRKKNSGEYDKATLWGELAIEMKEEKTNKQNKMSERKRK